MSDFTTEITIAVEQNYKEQDQPFYGKTPSGKTYFGIWDGHGSNSVIQELRSIMKSGKLDEIMDTESPVQSITDHLLENHVCRTYESSGATMNFCVFDGGALVCTNCGDSRTFVFRNGQCIFISEDHNSKNKKEPIVTTKPASTSQPSSGKKGGLFGDDDDDDFLFSKKKSTGNTNSVGSGAKKGLFDD